MGKEEGMKRILRFKKRTYVLAGVVAVAAISAVGGYAYWTSSGTGQGSATTGTDTKWEVTSDVATVANALTPGGPSETVKYRVKNNSSGIQALFKVNFQIATSNNADPSSTPGVWTASIDVLKPDCTKADFELSADGSTWAAAGVAIDDSELAGDVAAGATTADGTIQIRMINKPSSGGAPNNQDNCKSVTVPLFLAAS
jgi:hypothetical protein